MTYADQFTTAMTPFFKANNVDHGAAADAGLRLSVSIMSVFKVLRDLSTTTKDLPPDFRQNVMIAISELIAVWPNDPIMTAYGGRFWHNVQMALADWTESPVHQVKAEQAPDSTEKVKKQVRAVALQETCYSVIMDVARFAGVVSATDAEYGIKLREAVDKAMRE